MPVLCRKHVQGDTFTERLTNFLDSNLKSDQSDLTREPHRYRARIVQSYTPGAVNVHHICGSLEVGPTRVCRRTASRSVHPFRHGSPLCPSTRTTEWATFVAIACIYATRPIWPQNQTIQRCIAGFAPDSPCTKDSPSLSACRCPGRDVTNTTQQGRYPAHNDEMTSLAATVLTCFRLTNYVQMIMTSSINRK